MDTLKKEQLKEEIFKWVKGYNIINFSELIGLLNISTEGDFEIKIKENLILWRNCSQEFAQAFIDLVNEKRILIKFREMNGIALGYILEGTSECPRLPIARKIQPYKEPHWIMIDIVPSHLKDLFKVETKEIRPYCRLNK